MIQELQNSIHAIQVQWREAEHVRIRYKEIKHLLLEDAARFESNIGYTKIELQRQQLDIEHLKEVSPIANIIYNGYSKLFIVLYLLQVNR